MTEVSKPDPIALNHDDDHLREECGIFGIFSHRDAASLTALGLHALQHRGQEAAGIASFNGEKFVLERHLGLVGDGFSKKSVIDRLAGQSALGHVRYSTSGAPVLRNIQPLYADFAGGGFAMAHNGNLTNAEILRAKLQAEGAIFQSSNDSEVILHLIARRQGADLIEKLTHALKEVEGAYSLIGMSEDKLIGARDPLGIRPLILGRIDKSYVLTSETCALDIVGAQYVRDIAPGELVIISAGGVESLMPFGQTRHPRFCIFEFVYFSRPDSQIDGINVYEVRKSIGRVLANEAPVDADIVVPVPDSGTPAAIGYAAAAGLPFEIGIVRNHYIGRTFIQPTEAIRLMSVKLKHSANKTTLRGKRVILVDDSIVRGTTSKKIVQLVREAGAREIHLRIASPPTISSCYYGVNTPDVSKLIAAHHSPKEIADIIGSDSVAFLSIDGLYRAVSQNPRDQKCPAFCDACFTGDYPVNLRDQENRKSGQKMSHLADVLP